MHAAAAGDWFNRIDWTGVENAFGSGLPVQTKNGAQWGFKRPLLALAERLRPSAADMQDTHALFQVGAARRTCVHVHVHMHVPAGHLVLQPLQQPLADPGSKI